MPDPVSTGQFLEMIAANNGFSINTSPIHNAQRVVSFFYNHTLKAMTQVSQLTRSIWSQTNQPTTSRILSATLSGSVVGGAIGGPTLALSGGAFGFFNSATSIAFEKVSNNQQDTSRLRKVILLSTQSIILYNMLSSEMIDLFREGDLSDARSWYSLSVDISSYYLTSRVLGRLHGAIQQSSSIPENTKNILRGTLEGVFPYVKQFFQKTLFSNSLFSNSLDQAENSQAVTLINKETNPTLANNPWKFSLLPLAQAQELNNTGSGMRLFSGYNAPLDKFPHCQQVGDELLGCSRVNGSSVPLPIDFYDTLDNPALNETDLVALFQVTAETWDVKVLTGLDIGAKTDDYQLHHYSHFDSATYFYVECTSLELDKSINLFSIPNLNNTFSLVLVNSDLLTLQKVLQSEQVFTVLINNQEVLRLPYRAIGVNHLEDTSFETILVDFNYQSKEVSFFSTQKFSRIDVCLSHQFSSQGFFDTMKDQTIILGRMKVFECQLNPLTLACGLEPIDNTTSSYIHLKPTSSANATQNVLLTTHLTKSLSVMPTVILTSLLTKSPSVMPTEILTSLSKLITSLQVHVTESRVTHLQTILNSEQLDSSSLARIIRSTNVPTTNGIYSPVLNGIGTQVLIPIIMVSGLLLCCVPLSGGCLLYIALRVLKKSDRQLDRNSNNNPLEEVYVNDTSDNPLKEVSVNDIDKNQLKKNYMAAVSNESRVNQTESTQTVIEVEMNSIHTNEEALSTIRPDLELKIVKPQLDKGTSIEQPSDATDSTMDQSSSNGLVIEVEVYSSNAMEEKEVPTPISIADDSFQEITEENDSDHIEIEVLTEGIESD